MAISRRTILAGSAIALPPSWARAGEEYPARPITWVVPGGPGSVLDVAARLIALKLGAALGQSVVIDNRLGAGGTVAAEFAARSAPDGYTVFFGNFATFAIAPLLIPGLRYEARRDFTPVHGIGASANIIITGMKQSFTSIPGLIEQAKRNPGQVTYGASIGSGQHAAGALFAQKAGVELTLIPYSNFAQALNDTVAGRLDLMFDYPLSALPHVRDGKLRALAVNAGDRLAIAPEVPTLAEAGLAGAELLGWSGLYVPARTPLPIVARLAEATHRSLLDREVKALFDNTGTILWDGIDGPALGRALEEELPRMQRLIGPDATR
jgi:tripartite-type tricarboxylate transporter receptor subunit TctC